MKTRRLSTASLPIPVWRQRFDALALSWNTWWKERTAQERVLLRVAAVVIVAALVWMLALHPALNTIEKSRELLPRLHAEAAQVDSLILESQALQRRQTGKVDLAGMTDALNASLQRAALTDTVSLSETPLSASRAVRQWEVTLLNANAVHVMEWLAGLPYLLQLQTRVVDLTRASIDGRDRPGYVSGRIVIQQSTERAP